MIDKKLPMIVTDLDGTLLDRTARVPESNIKAIEKFKAAGGLFTLASGRYGNKVEELFPHYREYINAPAILCNGAYIYDFANDRAIFEESLPFSYVSDILKEINSRFSNIENVVIVKRNGILMCVNWDEVKEDRYYKTVINTDMETSEKIRTLVSERWGDKFVISKSSPKLIELLNPKATKNVALKFLKEYYPDVMIFAVGDYENDMGMLSAADIAACPSNAIDEVKNMSDVVLCDNNEGAIADLIDRILGGQFNG